MLGLEYGNHEKKISQFIGCRDAVNAETSHVENLMHFSLYKAIQPRELMLKKWSYFMALIMNLIMLFSMEQNRAGSNSYVNGRNRPTFKYMHREVTTTMTVLGVVQLVTSSVVLALTLVVRAPLIFRKLEMARGKRLQLKWREENIKGASPGYAAARIAKEQLVLIRSTFTSVTMFTVTLLVFFGVVMVSTYDDRAPQVTLRAALLYGVLGLCTFSWSKAWRSYFGVANHHFGLGYCFW